MNNQISYVIKEISEALAADVNARNIVKFRVRFLE